MSRALVIGHNGQDGTYLSRLLREKGYAVTGIGRPSTGGDSFDVTDSSQMLRLVAETRPDEIYYLAAFHHSSEDAPIDDRKLRSASLAINTVGVQNVLGAVLFEKLASRIFYAGSSRMFGNPATSPQNEETPFRPTCAYGTSKVAGAEMCSDYRMNWNVFAATGILFNHESPLRPAKFISRKIVSTAVRIAGGSTEKLTVGNLEAQVDWGYAPDYARAMWEMLQLDAPDDFVIGTGILHSVRDFAEAAFGALGLDWRAHVQEDPNFLARPAPNGILRADSSKLQAASGWQPQVDFRQMVQIMVEAEKVCL